MRSWGKILYRHSGKKLFRVASPTDSNAFNTKIAAIRSHFQTKTEEQHVPLSDTQKSAAAVVRTSHLFPSLEFFIRETIYLPRKLSVVVEELQDAGASITEKDAVFAFRTVGEGTNTQANHFEKSLAQVDALWKILPQPLRENSVNVQFHFLQYTDNIYEALVIIEQWAKASVRSRGTGSDTQRPFPAVHTDFISGIIAEASLRIKKPFEFALFLLELFVKSRHAAATDGDLVLFRLPVPSSALSALFLTITTGVELKSATQILDVQLRLAADRGLSTVLAGVQFTESVVEAVLFGCSRATDYEHRLDVAQGYFRRYKDECMITSGQQVTALMYESLMYMAADLGEIDIHQNLRIEANALNGSINGSQIVAGNHSNPQRAPEKASTGQYASHLIALARAGFLADIVPSLHVMLENKITPPIRALEVIIEEIGGLSKRKKTLLTASLQSGRNAREKSMTACYANLPPQYHNGFQMVNDVLKVMRSFGLDVHRALSFREYEKSRGKTRIPLGSHASFVKCMIEAYTSLGSDSKLVLQNFFLPLPAQYSIDSFCQLESQCDCDLVRDRNLCQSIFMLFLLRCFPQRKFPEIGKNELAHVPPGAAVFRFPSHELKTIREINDVIFEEALRVVNPENRLSNREEVNSQTLQVQAHIQKLVPKNFTFPTSSILQHVCAIEKPIVLFPISLDHLGTTAEAVEFGDAIEAYLHGLQFTNRTVIIPFSFVADVHFALQNHEGELGEESPDGNFLAEAFRKFFSERSNVWYVSFEEELIIRSYNRGKNMTAEISTGSNCHRTCTSCSLHFIQGLLELLKSCSGGLPMPISVYAGGENAHQNATLEQKLHRWRGIVDLIEGCSNA